MIDESAVRAVRPSLVRHVLSILLLPVTNTLVVPSIILLSTGRASRSWLLGMHPAQLVYAGAALTFLLAGLGLVGRSIAHFVRDGQGTLAPWDPPQRLVVTGLYKLCRNPMKIGLFAILASESMIFRSVPLALWFVAFVVVNVVYIRLSEEPGLRRRFGNAYERYSREVPRWLPRVGLVFPVPRLPGAGR